MLIKDAMPPITHNLTISQLQDVFEFVEKNIKFNGTIKVEYENMRIFPFAEEKKVIINPLAKYKDPMHTLSFDLENIICMHCRHAVEYDDEKIIKHVLNHLDIRGNNND